MMQRFTTRQEIYRRLSQQMLCRRGLTCRDCTLHTALEDCSFHLTHLLNAGLCGQHVAEHRYQSRVLRHIEHIYDHASTRHNELCLELDPFQVSRSKSQHPGIARSRQFASHMRLEFGLTAHK